MLTENRKRARSGVDVENGDLLPQAKRQSMGHPVSPEPGRDACDIESSSSEANISSPEHLVAGSSSQCADINRILKEAHFQSLHCRAMQRDTHQLCLPNQ
uniref:Uncharacterized protein n=1 Tax=Knipowitschia caucasica TaxID=637954 RepID=A0AAV2KL94_KNICA